MGARLTLRGVAGSALCPSHFSCRARWNSSAMSGLASTLPDEDTLNRLSIDKAVCALFQHSCGRHGENR